MSLAQLASRVARAAGSKAASRGAAAFPGGPRITPHFALAAEAQARPYAVVSGAATAGAAAMGSGVAFRLLGYNITWPVIWAVSLTAVVGAYAWEAKQIASVDRQPLEAEVMKAPPLPTGALLMSQTGKKVDVAAAVRGKHALLAFGALHSTDHAVLENMAKAAESAKQRTGAEVVPVYVSLDPAHDRPEDLRVAAGRSGSAATLVVTGPPDGLLGAAERFKNAAEARTAAAGGLDASKRAGEAATVRGYVSDNLYVVDPAGRVVAMISKNSRPGDLAGALATEVQRSAAPPPVIP